MKSWREHVMRYQPAYLVVLISVIPALVLLLHLLAIRDQQVNSLFQQETSRVVAGLEKGVTAGTLPIAATAGFFSANPGAGATEWNRFSEHSGLRAVTRERGQLLLDIGLIWRTRAGEQSVVAERFQKLGYSPVYQDSRVVGDDRFIGVLLENFEGRQPMDTAWDASSDGEVRLAMELARDSGSASATGVVGLYRMRQKSRVPGWIVLVPIYGGNAPPADLAQRRSALLGFAYGTLIPETLGTSLASDWDNSLVAWSVLESTASGARLLAGSKAQPSEGRTPKLMVQQSLALLGRPWTLKVSSMPQLERSPQGALPWIVFLAGLTVSGALFSIALSQVRARRLAEEVAGTLKRAEVSALREKQFSEAILNDLPGLFVLIDDQGRLVRWNRYVEQLTGLGVNELQQLRGRDLFNAGDSDAAADQLAEVFRKGHTQMEVRLRAKEGQPVPYFFSGYRFQSAERSFCIGIGLDLRDREKAQEEVHRAQHLTRQVIDSAQQGVVVFDRQLRCVIWNPFMQRTTGIKDDQLLGKDLLVAIPELAAHGVESALRSALQGTPVETPPFQIQFPGLADPVWFACSYAPLRASDEAVMGVILMVREVGEARRAELAIAGQNLILERVVRGESLETIGAAICQQLSRSVNGLACAMTLRMCPSGNQKLFTAGNVSDRLQQSLAAQAEKIFTGHRPAGTAAPDWPGELDQYVAVQPARGTHLSRTIAASDGTILGAIALLGPGGAACRDADSLLEGAARLASVAATRAEATQKAGLFVALAENSSDFVGFAELGGRVLYINQAGRELAGLSEDFLKQGTSYIDLFDKSCRKRLEEELVPRLVQEGRAHHEIGLQNFRDGSAIPVECTAFVLSPDEETKTRFVAIVARDIRERIRGEVEREGIARKLVETQKFESLGVLAGGIAHDFNNLLAGILGSADLARMELGPKSSVEPLLAQIEESSKRAAGLCSQLLAYAGKGRFLIEPLDISAVVQDSASLLRHSIDPGCELRLDLGRNLPQVEADAQQLRQALVNLVVNAAEAIGEKPGAIDVTTRLISVGSQHLAKAITGCDLPAGTYVSLEVRDTGSGIDPSMVDRICDPFFTTKFPGRGLGLASVLGIVRSHKGALNVESSPGVGSKFQIWLPPAPRADQRRVRETDTSFFVASKSTQPESNKVLVVDDEEYVREVTSRLLEAWGCEVHRASNGREAVERFKRDPQFVGAVVIDLAMPEMDGATACREIRKLNPNVQFVVMSGFSAAEVASHFAGESIASFLQKPFTAERLHHAVSTMVKCSKPSFANGGRL